MNVQHAPPGVTESRERHSSARLQGCWLVLARVLWVALAVLALGLFFASLPTYFAYLHILVKPSPGAFGPRLTPNDVRSLQAVGLSLDFYAWFTILFSLLFLFVFVSVGVLLFWRKSDDRMALLASISLVLFPVAFSQDIVGTLPPAWMLPSAGVVFLGDVCIGLFFYLFPSGWFVPRWTRWLALGWIAYWGLDLFVPFFGNLLLGLLSFVLLLGLIGSLVVVQVYHYRRVSTPVERQQTKWVVFGIALALGSFAIGSTVLYGLVPLLFSLSPLFYVIGQTLLSLLFLLFPLSLGFAILRSRLWDIDILINRTVVYGTLTVILTGLYVGLVIGLQALLRGIISHDSGVAIVVSTLAIAALFHPLRRRIQQVIDRRFYRRKYDAARTLAAFSATLRQEVDLEQLREQLLAVVQETMQPAHISLWLRPSEQASTKQATWNGTPPAPQEGEEQ
jgi:hypothetical protein